MATKTFDEAYELALEDVLGEATFSDWVKGTKKYLHTHSKISDKFHRSIEDRDTHHKIMRSSAEKMKEIRKAQPEGYRDHPEWTKAAKAFSRSAREANKSSRKASIASRAGSRVDRLAR